MTRRERPGNRYLAGLVIGMAVPYFGLAYVAAVLPWPDGSRAPSLVDFILLGLLPSLATIMLGIGGWRAKGGRSAAYSAAGLLVLLAGLTLLRVRGILR